MIELNQKNMFTSKTEFQKRTIDNFMQVKKLHPDASFNEIHKEVEQEINYENLINTEIDDTKLLEKFNKKFGNRTYNSVCNMPDEYKKYFLYKDSSRQTISETLQLFACGLEKIPQTKNSKKRLDEHHIADAEFNGIEYTLKYTKEPGGSQNNQLKDVEYFLEQKGALGGAILDGDFWDVGRRENLKTKYPLSHVYSTEEFIEMRNNNGI